MNIVIRVIYLSILIIISNQYIIGDNVKCVSIYDPNKHKEVKLDKEKDDNLVDKEIYHNLDKCHKRSTKNACEKLDVKNSQKSSAKLYDITEKFLSNEEYANAKKTFGKASLIIKNLRKSCDDKKIEELKKIISNTKNILAITNDKNETLLSIATKIGNETLIILLAISSKITAQCS